MVVTARSTGTGALCRSAAVWSEARMRVVVTSVSSRLPGDEGMTPITFEPLVTNTASLAGAATAVPTLASETETLAGSSCGAYVPGVVLPKVIQPASTAGLMVQVLPAARSVSGSATKASACCCACAAVASVTAGCRACRVASTLMSPLAVPVSAASSAAVVAATSRARPAVEGTTVNVVVPDVQRTWALTGASAVAAATRDMNASTAASS